MSRCQRCWRCWRWPPATRLVAGRYAAMAGRYAARGGPLRGYGGRAATRHKYTIPVQSYFMKPSMWEGYRRHTGPELDTGGMRDSKQVCFQVRSEYNRPGFTQRRVLQAAPSVAACLLCLHVHMCMHNMHMRMHLCTCACPCACASHVHAPCGMCMYRP